METIIIQADAKKAKAIKEFLKAFDITFKTSKKEESPCDSEFVKMVLKASKEEGSTTLTKEYKQKLFQGI
jgi:hypothetical protein